MVNILIADWKILQNECQSSNATNKKTDTSKCGIVLTSRDIVTVLEWIIIVGALAEESWISETVDGFGAVSRLTAPIKIWIRDRFGKVVVAIGLACRSITADAANNGAAR